MIAGDQHHCGAELRQAEHEHQRGQHGREGDADHRQPDAAQHALRQRGHHHAERHAADRLPRQHDGRLAALAAQAMAEAQHDGGGVLAAGIHDGGDRDGQQELHEHAAETAGGGGEPSGRPWHVKG